MFPALEKWRVFVETFADYQQYNGRSCSKNPQ
jgi:hypothetical protein